MSIGVVLLVTADSSTIHLINHTLHELSLSPDLCREAPTAIRLLNRRKFDAVIVDLQLGEPSGAILDEVRLSPSNRTAVTFGIGSSDPNITNAFRQKSDFFFERPLSAKSIRNTLKPAYSLILRERRRYFRYPVSVPVFILRKNQQEVRCSSVNVSEGGMALSTFVPFIPGEDVRVQFTLPEQDRDVPVFAEATICWGKTGHLGVRFKCMSDEHKSGLQVWLSRKLEETLPDFVAGQFRKAEHSSK